MWRDGAVAAADGDYDLEPSQGGGRLAALVNADVSVEG